LPRFGKAAIAAAAGAAVLLTASAAYAHGFNRNKVAGDAATTPSMNWAHYRGDLTDLSTKTDDVKTTDMFDGAKATAMMVGINGETLFRLNVYGIDDAVVGKRFGAHLHEATCEIDNGTAAGPHYNITPYDPVTKTFETVSDQTEVWLDFAVNPEGTARVTVSVPFIPKPGLRSIVLHATPTVHHSEENRPAVGSAGSRLACLPLEINQVASTS
jgi:Cu/Zn superoxide dismutase